MFGGVTKLADELLGLNGSSHLHTHYMKYV